MNYLKRVQQIRKMQLDIMADIEASIDYPEYDEVEEVTNKRLKKVLIEIKEKLEKLEKSYSNGKILKGRELMHCYCWEAKCRQIISFKCYSRRRQGNCK